MLPTTIEKLLDLSRKTLVPRDDLQQRLTSKKGEATRGVEAREGLEVELLHANVMLKVMEDWKKRVTDAGQEAAAAFLEVVRVKGELSKVAQKQTEFERRLGMVEAEFGHGLICLNAMLVKQARMHKVFRGVIDKSVCVFDGFDCRLDADLLNSSRVVLKSAYSAGLSECHVALTHVSGARL